MGGGAVGGGQGWNVYGPAIVEWVHAIQRERTRIADNASAGDRLEADRSGFTWSPGLAFADPPSSGYQVGGLQAAGLGGIEVALSRYLPWRELEALLDPDRGPPLELQAELAAFAEGAIAAIGTALEAGLAFSVGGYEVFEDTYEIEVSEWIEDYESARKALCDRGEVSMLDWFTRKDICRKDVC